MNQHSGIFSQTNSSVTYKKVACYIKCMFNYYLDSCTTSYIMSGAEKKMASVRICIGKEARDVGEYKIQWT